MLHVWLMSQQSPLFVWRPEQKTWQPQADWQQIRANFGDSTVCLYFPSRHLQQISTELSASQLKQLGEAGRQYLFEETSLTPVEQLTVKELHSGMGQQLFAVANNDLQAWQQSAVLGNYTLTALLPDFLLLPIPEEGAGQQLNLYQDQFTTLIRQSESQGMAVSFMPLVIERLPHLNEICVLAPIASSVASLTTQALVDSLKDTLEDTADADRADLTANLLMPQSETSDSLDSASSTSSSSESHSLSPSISLQKQDLGAQLRSDVIITELTTQPLPVSLPERHPLNFYSKSSDSRLSPYLKVTMMVAMMALVFQLSADALQYYQYKKATDATKLATREQYNAWFPNEPLSPTNTVEVALKPKLAGGVEAQSEHLAILTRLAPLIKQSSLVAQTLVIEPNSLSFTVVGDSRESLDKFASTLTAQGFNASLGSVGNPEPNKVAGQVTIAIAETAVSKES